MAIKRTREQKRNPNHNFILSWNPQATYAHVNGQKDIGHSLKISEAKMVKKAESLAQSSETKSIKHGIVRSLITISLILCLELVIYSIWK